MKPLQLIFALSLVLTTGLISSCSKDDDPTLSRLELLTQKPWKLKSTITERNGYRTPDSYSIDDTYTYNTDGTYVYDQGTKINSSAPQTVNRTWEFGENETIIKLSEGGDIIDQEILELSELTLKVKFFNTVDIEATFGH